MNTYWDAFIMKYNDIKDVDLIVILEAFYYFCNGDSDLCDKIIVYGKWK
jgi:hypothetical protein